jgi:hypothetical protein
MTLKMDAPQGEIESEEVYDQDLKATKDGARYE